MDSAGLRSGGWGLGAGWGFLRVLLKQSEDTSAARCITDATGFSFHNLRGCKGTACFTQRKNLILHLATSENIHLKRGAAKFLSTKGCSSEQERTQCYEHILLPSGSFKPSRCRQLAEISLLLPRWPISTRAKPNQQRLKDFGQNNDLLALENI